LKRVKEKEWVVQWGWFLELEMAKGLGSVLELEWKRVLQ
jgi:hypothetical protein